MEFNGYLYTTLKDCQVAIDKINLIEGFPTSDNSTITYCEPIKCDLGYAIISDDITDKYLINKILIEIIEKNIQ
jgi:hypothetical protein